MASLEEVGKRWIQAFNARDLKGLMALYAENCVNTQPHHIAPQRGRKAVEDDLGAFMNAFPDGRMDARVFVADGDMLAMEWTFTGTHRGPLIGPAGVIRPTNRSIKINGAEFTRVDASGLIVDERGYFDHLTFMMQLGLAMGPVPSGG